MMELEAVSETSDANSTFTWLIAQEDCIAFMPFMHLFSLE
jgi:hypothetical protein